MSRSEACSAVASMFSVVHCFFKATCPRLCCRIILTDIIFFRDIESLQLLPALWGPNQQSTDIWQSENTPTLSLSFVITKLRTLRVAPRCSLEQTWASAPQFSLVYEQERPDSSRHTPAQGPEALFVVPSPIRTTCQFPSSPLAAALLCCHGFS